MTLTLLRDHYPYLLQGRTLTIRRAILMLKLSDGTLYDDAQLSVELRARRAARKRSIC